MRALLSNPILRTLILFSIFIGPIHSYADSAVKPNRCAALFSSSSGIWQKTKNYGREVLDSRGRRLFLKSVEEDGNQTKWYGLLTKQEPDFTKKGVSKYLSSIINYLPKKIGGLLARDSQYRLTPFSGLYNVTMQKPVGYLTRKLGGTKFEPAFFFKFPVVLALSIGVYLGADAVYQSKLQGHINTEITNHSIQYEKIISSDFRYNKIRVALEKGEISQEESQREAYMISLAYSQYFQFRDSQSKQPTVESESSLLDHYLFAHLKPVIENGVSKADGYKVPKSSLGPLSESQILDLFQNAHIRYLKYQIVVEMLKGSDLYQKMKLDPHFSEVVRRIEDDPFARKLMSLHERGTISADQLQIYLQEDIYWQNRFQDWETIGVTRLKLEGDKFSDQPLYIEDIRNEILIEINS